MNRTIGSDKENFMRLFLVLYMEAKKIALFVRFPFNAFMVLNSEQRRM